jgi:hypothetical protein
LYDNQQLFLPKRKQDTQKDQEQKITILYERE